MLEVGRRSFSFLFLWVKRLLFRGGAVKLLGSEYPLDFGAFSILPIFQPLAIFFMPFLKGNFAMFSFMPCFFRNKI